MTEPDDGQLPLLPDMEGQPVVQLTPAQQMRARQSALIAHGQHPLALVLGPLPLAPAAGHDEHLTCGTCFFRRNVGHRSRGYPKCLFGETVQEIPPEYRRPNGPTRKVTRPRVTHGAATDVRAWWPACTDWLPEDS